MARSHLTNVVKAKQSVGISYQMVVALGWCLRLLCTSNHSLEQTLTDTSDQTVVALGWCLRVKRVRASTSGNGLRRRHQLPDGVRPGLVFAREACSNIYSGQPLIVVGISYQAVVALGRCLHAQCVGSLWIRRRTGLQFSASIWELRIPLSPLLSKKVSQTFAALPETTLYRPWSRSSEAASTSGIPCSSKKISGIRSRL